MSSPRRVRYGSLDCIVFDSAGNGAEDADQPHRDQEASPNIAVVLCHGYGAPGHDLAGLAPEWIRLLGESAKSVRFIFPAAPHSLAELGMPDGRAWWPINMAQLSQAVQSSSFDELHDKEPPGIDEARAMLCESIRRVKAELIGDSTPLVLGGFSQGAMLTMDASLRGDFDPPKYLIQFSGTLVCQSQWQARLSRLADTQVYQSHGTIDPILPFKSAQRLNEILLDSGVQAEFHSFDGPHTIDVDSIAKTAMAIKEIAANANRC